TLGGRTEGVVDRNLRSGRAFGLPNERNRSVFAPRSAIDARSGLIAAGAGRVYPEIGAVRMHVSDMQYRATQLSLALTPVNPLWGASRLFLVYGYSRTEYQAREYPTIDADRIWQTGSSPRHRFDIGLTELGPRWFRMITRATVQSGRAFTPLVAQDINGDGLANDRAFIPNSRASTDFDTFVRNAAPAVRSCLTGQAGEVAEAFSCKTGWRIKFDVAVNGTAPSDFGLGRRVRFSLNFFNVSSALVQLLKLDASPFARDSRSQVDQRLFFVNGFDSTTSSYRYLLNSNFGQPRKTAALNGPSPFEMRLGVQVLLGASAPRLGRVDALRARAPQALVSSAARDSLVRMFRGPDVMNRLVQLLDSLKVDSQQRVGLTATHRTYLQSRDSLLEDVYATFERTDLSQSVDERIRRLMRDNDPALSRLEQSSLARALSFLTADQRELYHRMTKR
ncbi:MAG: hypothetical protein ACO1Q7_07340, partial [Gemmatimonas sp.]